MPFLKFVFDPVLISGSASARSVGSLDSYVAAKPGECMFDREMVPGGKKRIATSFQSYLGSTYFVRKIFTHNEWDAF